MLSLLLSLALADEAGDAWLQKVDTANNAGDDAHIGRDLKGTDKKGETAERTIEIWQKGEDKRLVRFTAPARLEGVGLLVPDGETVYLYLPTYERAKRVTGDQRSDAFLGTDFSIGDLSQVEWVPEYTAVIEQDEGAELRLMLTPKDPKAHAHASVRMWVRKTDNLPSKIEYLDAAGQPLRRLTLSGYRDAGPRPIAHHLKVEDLEKGTWTEATVDEAVFDKGLEDDLFTLRELER